MQDIKADELVLAYRKIRDAIQEKEDAHKQEIASLRTQQELISDALLGLCNDQNLDSIRTSQGTVTRSTTTRYWTSDWESMHKFILEHKMPELLERRISQTTMKQLLEENPDLMPPGLNTDSRYAVTIRRASNGV